LVETTAGEVIGGFTTVAISNNSQWVQDPSRKCWVCQLPGWRDQRTERVALSEYQTAIRGKINSFSFGRSDINIAWNGCSTIGQSYVDAAGNPGRLLDIRNSVLKTWEAWLVSDSMDDERAGRKDDSMDQEQARPMAAEPVSCEEAGPIEEDWSDGDSMGPGRALAIDDASDALPIDDDPPLAAPGRDRGRYDEISSPRERNFYP
jgi:hypothetical protein